VTAASFFRDITAFSIQIALVAIGLAVLLKLVRIPASARYFGLRLALVASLIAPWLLRAPEVQAPAFARAVTQATPASVLPAATVPSAATASAGSPARSLPPIPWLQVGFGALLIGIAVRVVRLGMGVLRLFTLKRDGVVVDAPEYSELQHQIGTRATIAHVAALPQPATFGVRRPIVLLPDTLVDASSSLRRAVVAHELFHVRRRDWLSVLAEEAVRTALWFHPAILWMTSQIQLAREEIVDELTVQATGDRRTYVEALLAFADTPGFSPAPAFAQRRQLFHRILTVSKERVMSRPRMLSSAAVLLATVAAASWYASTLFPILKAAKADVQTSAPSSAAEQSHVQSGSQLALSGHVEFRDGNTTLRAASAKLLLDEQGGQSASVRAVTPENPIPRRTRGVTPVTPSQFSGAGVVVISLVTLDRSGAVTAVDRSSCGVTDGHNNDAAVCAAFVDSVVTAIRQWRYDRPAQGPIQFYVTVTFRPGAEPSVTQSSEDMNARDWTAFVRDSQNGLRVLQEDYRREQEHYLTAQAEELIARSRELERAQRLSERGLLANPDRATLQAQMDRLNAELAQAEAQLRNARAQDRASDQGRIEEQLRAARANLEAQRSVEAQVERRDAEARLNEAAARLERAGTGSASRQLVSPSGRTPIRVGDIPGMKPPTVRKNVKPEHPIVAMKARVEGTVVLEALVDEQGRVADVRVTKSIPLLDQAAMDAARQWEFTPTLMNGEPVPVLLQLEMDFRMR
jgi:TonB family protein